MEHQSGKYEAKATRWELVLRTIAYTTIFFAAVAFIFMIFRAVHLISQYQPGIDPMSYAETHIYVVLVEIVLWMLMARAAIRLKAYTRRIRSGPDGAALDYIANAMLASFVYAILFDIASTFKTLFMKSPYLSTVTTITNLVPLAVFTGLSILLFVGSYKLKRVLPPDRAQRQRNQRFIAMSLAVFALVVVPFAQYFYHVAPLLTDDDGLPHFALSPNILIAVYLAPFVLVWLLGLLASLNLAEYANRVRGKLYRPMFRNLCIGILTAYASTYLVQIFYVSNVPSNRPGFGLYFLLSLIGLLITGYAFTYRGANQLYTLER